MRSLPLQCILRGLSAPALSAFVLSAFLCACGKPEATYFSENREIAVFRVVAPAPINVGKPQDATMAVYAMILNRGGAADSLIGLESPIAAKAGVHATVTKNGMSTMEPVAALPIPPGEPVILSPGATHVMLEELTRLYAPGDSVPVAFVFRRSGRVSAVARIVTYEEIQKGS